MQTKTIFFSIIIALAFFTAVWLYFGRNGYRQNLIVSAGRIETRISPIPGFDGQGVPQEPEEISVDSRRTLFLSKPTQPVLAMPSPVVENSSPPSSVVLPSDLVQAESEIEQNLQNVPKPPPVVLPPEGVSTVKLCGGEQISRCADCDFSHFDLALLILDILNLGRAREAEGAFETLESLDIEPAGGWAKSNPDQPMTPREMEEVRCSISLAAEVGSVPVEPAVVTAAMNRFCEEFEVSIKALRDSGVAKGGHTGGYPTVPAETGYQGGEDSGVVSSAF